MDKTKYELERWAFRQQREHLERNGEYLEWQKKRDQAMERFRERYSGEAAGQCGDLLDLEGALVEYEKLFLFWLGVRLGLAVGGADVLGEE